MKDNHRLCWAFRICEALGIDDPVHWMNSVSPSVLDQWIAYKMLEDDIKAGKAAAKASTPEAALDQLRSLGAFT